MNSVLHKIESDEVVIYVDRVYSEEFLKKCRLFHKELVESGRMIGEFESEIWTGYSGVKKNRMNFCMKSCLYKEHIGKEFNISEDTMKNMLRCFALYRSGNYIYRTIGVKINAIKNFLQRYKDKDYRVTMPEVVAIEDFLGFIQTPYEQIEYILSNLKLVREKMRGQRELATIINYLVVQNEINHIYRHNCRDDIFIRWFPIYFWANVTFVIPIRATEMLVTPKECVVIKDGKKYIRIRRTRLKKGRSIKKVVYHFIENDYEEILCGFPNDEVIDNIKKYMKLTANQDRRFLFIYNEFMINEMLSLNAFNNLLALFIDENIIGNRRYDFVKYATDINEFEHVSAGDSRPIAIANIYFQDFSEDICRQIAGHVHVNTTAGYYTNISETIWASSIVKLQRKLNNECRESEKRYNQNHVIAIGMDKSVCLSPKRLNDCYNIDDCIEQEHLSECMGCKFYRPSNNELENFLRRHKEKADNGAKQILEVMNGVMKTKNKEIDLEELFLSIQTDAVRYRMGCEIKAEEELRAWENI